MKKTPRKIDSSLSYQQKHDDYDTNELQDTQSNGKPNLDEIEDLNISKH